MVPTIRIDDDVWRELRNKAKDFDLVFEPPNSTLRIILGLDSIYTQNQKVSDITNNEGNKPNNVTLILSTPWYKKDDNGQVIGKPGGPVSFEKYMETGIGKGYAIPKEEVKILVQGSKVVILRNDWEKKRAEGVLDYLEETGEKTTQGIKRYHVHFNNQKEVIYHYNKPIEKVTRRGVKVIKS